MLAPVWALLPSSWSSVGRVQHLRWDIISRALSQSTTRYNSFSVGLGFPTRNLLHATPIDVAKEAPVVRDPSVFEEQLDEYATVGSTVQLPSTLSLVEERLPERLPQPSQGDASIFEDASDYDYAPFTSTTTQSPSSLSETLVRLVLSKNYDEAYHLLTEVQNSGLALPFSYVYENAAQAVFYSPSSRPLDQSEQISRFVTWFSLVPPSHLAGKIRKFHRSRRVVFQSIYSDVFLAIPFATLLASKGYAALITAEAIPYVMRFAPPDVSIQFIHDFEEAHKEYLREVAMDDPIRSTSRMATIVRGQAVKTLANSGYLKHAISLLPDPLSPAFRLTQATYDLLLRRLQQGNSSLEHIELVKGLRKHPETCIPTIREAVVQRQSSQMAKELDPNSNRFIGQSLAMDYKALSNAMRSREHPPDISALLDFFRNYLSTGRTEAISALEQSALFTPPECAGLFFLAKMIHHRQQGRDDLVIQTFVDTFSISGVPQEDVILHYQQFQLDRSYDQAIHENPSNHKYNPNWTSPTKQNIRWKRLQFRRAKFNAHHHAKLWPNTIHCDLVWQSLVALASSDAAVDRLYQKLVAIASGQPSPPHFSTVKVTNLPPSWRSPVGTGAFTPFIQRLLVSSDAARGTQILSDMARLGITPAIHHFTQLAGYYAKMGDTQRAFVILDTLEAQHPVDEPQSMLSSGQGKKGDQALPSPDVPLYTSVMRGFLMAKQVADALEVDARFRRRFVYVPGHHVRLDVVYDDLARLQEKQNHKLVHPKKHMMPADSVTQHPNEGCMH